MIVLGLRDEQHRSVCFANALTAAALAAASLAGTRRELLKGEDLPVFTRVFNRARRRAA